jgi:hypothetical protein
VSQSTAVGREPGPVLFSGSVKKIFLNQCPDSLVRSSLWIDEAPVVSLSVCLH